jgi:hypothetical protein
MIAAPEEWLRAAEEELPIGGFGSSCTLLILIFFASWLLWSPPCGLCFCLHYLNLVPLRTAFLKAF